MKKFLSIMLLGLLSNAINLHALPLTEVPYVKKIPIGKTCIIGADIGGTNSNFGIFDLSTGKLELLLSIHLKSNEITNFTDALKDVLTYLKNRYAITVKKASLACAGAVSKEKTLCKITNSGFLVDANDIVEHTEIEYAYIANDFEVIGFGINAIDQNKLIEINKGDKVKTGTKAIFGAGTGLGKCLLLWDKNQKRYFPLATEGGHTDFPVQNKTELELVEFIKQTEQIQTNIRWEDILSGIGVSRLYNFFCWKNNVSPTLARDKIFSNKDTDKQCLSAYQLFTQLYGRLTKNVALDSLARGGIYIAGGIAAKYPHMFDQEIFMDAFTSHSKHSNLLKSIPVYVITDYNISLYGAVELMLLESV